MRKKPKRLTGKVEMERYYIDLGKQALAKAGEI